MKLNENQLRGLVGLFIGEQLGSGVYRKVYEHAQEEGMVIKVEDADGGFANVREWEFWLAHADAPKWSRWLAPCVSISPCGLVLVQRRTTPILSDEAPKQVPAFFTDIKLDNWGKLDGRVVCHDYANHLGLQPSLRLRKASW